MTRFSIIVFIGILMEIHFIYRIILILWVPKRHLERTVMEWMGASPCRSISENFRDCKVRVNLLRSAFCSCCFFWNCSQCLLGLAADFLEQGEYGHNTEEFLGRALHSFNGFNSSALDAVHLWWNALSQDLRIYQMSWCLISEQGTPLQMWAWKNLSLVAGELKKLTNSFSNILYFPLNVVGWKRIMFSRDMCEWVCLSLCECAICMPLYVCLSLCVWGEVYVCKSLWLTIWLTVYITVHPN